MPTGTVRIMKPLDEVMDKLRGYIAAANCEIVERSRNSLRFHHGTYLTQTATLFRKTCDLHFDEADGTTVVTYNVRTAPFIVVWLTLWGILFCWTIFMPIIAYRTLVHHPQRFVENLLAGI